MDFIRSHKLIVATIAIQIIALPLILLLVKERQQTQTQAQATTILFFNPTSSSSAPIDNTVGQNISLDLMLDPGQNQVSFAKVEINFDPSLLQPDPNNPVVVNTQAFPVTVEGPIISNGKIQVVVSVGSDQTRVIQSVTKLLTVNMKSLAASNPTTNVSINTSNTQLLSIAPQDTSTENVLETATPAIVKINAVAAPSPTPVACVPAYDENGGSVVIEAEHYYARTNNGNSHSWDLVNGGPYPEQPGDILYMRASPNDETTIGQNSISSSPEISFDIDFQTTGTYWVYARGSGAGANSHIVHMGLDDNFRSSLNNYYVGQDGYNSTWLWTSKNTDGTRPTVNITSPGVHSLHFWMRDSGAKIDRVRLVQNNSWTPSVNLSDKGPNESSRITCPEISPIPEPEPVCTQTQPQVTISGGSSKSVTPGQNTQYTINVTNQNSSGCDPTRFNIENLLNPTTPNITWSFSETSFTLASGATKTITLTINSTTSTSPGIYSNNVRTTDVETGLTTSTSLQLNVIAPSPTPQPSATPTPTVIPTATLTPVPTLANTVLNFNGLKLHGLGSGGDNPNPTSWGTLNPLRPTRDLTVHIYNTSGALVHTGNTTINYTGANTGLFNGSLTLPSSIVNGTYTIKITSPYYLTKLIPGFLNLIQGTTHNVTSVSLVAGDVNRDNQLRVSDYDLIMECYTDLLPAKPTCTNQKSIDSDISDDGVVNQDDYNLFLRELSVQAGD